MAKEKDRRGSAALASGSAVVEDMEGSWHGGLTAQPRRRGERESKSLSSSVVPDTAVLEESDEELGEQEDTPAGRT